MSFQKKAGIKRFFALTPACISFNILKSQLDTQIDNTLVDIGIAGGICRDLRVLLIFVVVIPGEQVVSAHVNPCVAYFEWQQLVW